jgi:cytochrome P450/NADPH-cytochrome P450 reductase
MKELQAEVDIKMAGRTPTHAECEHLDFTRWVVFETLRLYPTVPSFPRLSEKSTVLGGYHIPKKSMVFISQAAMNERKDLWGDDAHEFNPRRFEGVGKLRQSQPVSVPGLQKYGFIPFGAGQRTCIGQRLAIMEAIQILASVAKNFDVAVAMKHHDRGDGGVEVEECADITLGPKSGLYLEMALRGAVPRARL